MRNGGKNVWEDGKMGKSWEMMGKVARIIEEKKWLAKSWENGGKNWRENGGKIRKWISRKMGGGNGGKIVHKSGGKN